ncbi:uncharacterized membrane protein [Hoeflea halophila]|uniref:Uncharacterized membrane protein n=1 Tax=Hoeflea halophila TaxID=714899 RepID=A0A286HKM7_9HYPH|nr:DUF2157 domain-containing protein [Hoeflea halophila]SOE08373.1 uncharacterized membrane protein [Hoeflea halophila]
MLRRYLAREIDQWVEHGLLEATQAKALLEDHDRRHTGLSLSSVLAVLAAVLFGAAVIALVAANWEAIARPLRVALIFLFIIGGLSGAALAALRNAHWIAEAMLVFTLLCFGAGIALVGQMYHLSGDEADFLLSWTFGALVVSLSFSSPLAAISAGFLGLGYLFSVSDGLGMFSSWSGPDLTGYGLALSLTVAVGIAAWRSRSTMAGHLGAVMLLCLMVWIFEEATDLNPGYLLAAIGALVFATGSLLPLPPDAPVERHGTLSAYGAVLLLGGLGLVQADSDIASLPGSMAFAALVLGTSVCVLVVAGGENRMIRRFAYFAFCCETIYIVGETLGSLLGSAGFLFFGGLVLGALAYAMMRLEKRFKKEGMQP